MFGLFSSLNIAFFRASVGKPLLARLLLKVGVGRIGLVKRSGRVKVGGEGLTLLKVWVGGLAWGAGVKIGAGWFCGALSWNRSP